MNKGWFIGDFDPSIVKTTGFEVAVKYYKAGDYEPTHTHRIAKEITVVVEGTVEMNGRTFRTGDIIEIQPNEATDFRSITDARTAVVKIPSVRNDKFMLEVEPIRERLS
jgi:quercetin dioxygenase-like cupin family protein